MFKPSISARALLRLALAAVLLAVLIHTRADPDLWGHVRFGQDAVAAGAARASDVYSFGSDRPWINHEWLAEIAMYLAYAAAGAVGLIMLKAVLLASMLVAIVATVRAAGLAPSRADLMAGLAVIGTVAQGSHVRPQLFSLALFAALLAALAAVSRGRQAAILLSVPILGLWANLHGGWIVGAGVLAIWAAAQLVTSRAARKSLLVVVVPVVAVAATLVNPYGWRLWTFLFATVRFSRPEITDWQPISRLGPTFLLLWALFALVMIAALLRGLRQHALDVPSAVVVLALAAAAFRVNRLLAFFTIAIVMLLGRHLGSRMAGPLARPEATPAPPRLARAAAVAVALALIVGAAAASAHNLSCIHMDEELFPEADVARVVERNQLRGRMLVWFDWGEYAIWHFAPGLSVSMDGRRETVYSDEAIQEQLGFYFSPDARQAVVDHLRPDYIWMPTRLRVADTFLTDRASGADRASRGNGIGVWHPVYSGTRSTLLARAGVPHAAVAASPAVTAAGSAPPALRCFPGP